MNWRIKLREGLEFWAEGEPEEDRGWVKATGRFGETDRPHRRMAFPLVNILWMEDLDA